MLANSGILDAPIADSLKITYYIASKFADLIPDAHAAKIRQFLIDLHAINFFSLSFPGRPGTGELLRNAVQERLDRTDISVRYRKALEFKLDV